MEHVSIVKKMFITTLVLNAIALAAYGFLFFSIKDKNETVSSILSGADKDIQQDEFLRMAKFSLMDNRENIEKLDSYFVPRDGVPDFIEFIEQLGRDSGISLSIGVVAVEPDTRNKDDFKELLRLRTEGLGQWQNLFTFLSMIENLPFRVQIDRVSFALDGGQERISFDSVGTEDRSLSLWKGFVDFTLLKLR
jgi:Tfp pilus assembly protein PilO